LETRVAARLPVPESGDIEDGDGEGHERGHREHGLPGVDPAGEQPVTLPPPQRLNGPVDSAPPLGLTDLIEGYPAGS
jgi:hypothetical protein